MLRGSFSLPSSDFVGCNLFEIMVMSRIIREFDSDACVSGICVVTTVRNFLTVRMESTKQCVNAVDFLRRGISATTRCQTVQSVTVNPSRIQVGFLDSSITYYFRFWPVSVSCSQTTIFTFTVGGVRTGVVPRHDSCRTPSPRFCPMSLLM
jgi:hypothetical protein